MILTAPQQALLAKVRDKADGVYIYGPEVKVARKLAALGLVKLIDDGTGPLGGNRDGERWSIELTDAGRLAVPAEPRS